MAAMVVIKCPETDQEVPIGIRLDLHTLDKLPVDCASIECPACGKMHKWSKDNAFLSLHHPTNEVERRR